MKKILIVISAFLVFSSSFFGKNIMSAMAEEPDRAPQQKYYTSIRIEDGETLWSIAARRKRSRDRHRLLYGRIKKNERIERR